MSNKLKNYAVRVTFKKEGFKTTPFKGVVIAHSPKEAEDLVKENLPKGLKSTTPIDKSDIIVRKVELFSDFLFNINSK